MLSKKGNRKIWRDIKKLTFQIIIKRKELEIDAKFQSKRICVGNSCRVQIGDINFEEFRVGKKMNKIWN